MSKDIKSSSMDTLFQGLTGQSHPDSQVTVPEANDTIPLPPHTKKPSKGNYEVISTMVDPVIISKIRTIASIEDLSIKDVIGVGLKMVIARYEEVHGKVRVKRTKKGSINKVFNIQD